MIKLCVAEYCHTCPKFEAETAGPQVLRDMNGEIYHIGDAIITCANYDQCYAIRKHIEKESNHAEN